MKIKNPLDKDLHLLYKGEQHVLEAGVSKEFATDVAAQWINIYGFLSITKATDKEVDAVVEAADAPVEAVEEEKEEKKVTKKSTTKKTK